MPLDGTFRGNVMLQVKNGPIDFQPREPFHPLFGAMPHTPTVLELQITKEYLGQTTALRIWARSLQEVLHADTHARGQGSTVAKVIDGSLFGHSEHRHGRRRQYRQRPQLVRLDLQPGELVCVRPAGLGPRSLPARRSRRNGCA